MIEETSSNQGLPTNVGNPKTENVLELRKELDALTGQAMEMATSIVTQTQDLDALWDKLLPILAEVQAILSKHCSRRQERRAIGLPTWEHWRDSFLKESGLNVSDRTAQRRLKAFRAPEVPDTDTNVGRSRGATPIERYQGLLAQQARNNLFDALLEGDDLDDACARFLYTRIDPDRLRQIISNCPKPREANTIAAGQTGSSTRFTPSSISFCFGRQGVSHKCEIEFKPGAWALLAEYITIEHREHFEAVFGSLMPAEQRQVFLDFALTLAKSVVPLADYDNNLKLAAKSVTQDLEPTQAA